MEKTIRILVIISSCIIIISAIIFVTFIKLFPIKYTEQIEYYSNVYGLSPSLIASVINTESGFRENAQSNVGAVGLMQLLPTTAAYINAKQNLKLDIGNLTEPKTNINLGCAYLSFLLDKFTDNFTALCAYNAGEGNVRRWLTTPTYSPDGKKLTSTPFPATNYYVDKVLHDEKIYRKFFT